MLDFGIALGLGLLVGLQRQHSQDTSFAGLRTFSLITIFGFLCASYSPWATAAGLIACAALAASAHWVNARKSIVTEAALLSMYVIGAMTAGGHSAIAIAAATTIAVLLELKVELHGLAAKLGERDIKAILQFALITLVILPVLPDRTFGPYDVLNPRQIWWMVVLIVGINLAGYLAFRFVSADKSLFISGVLGGLISSTATTASYARKGGETALTVILIAGSTVYLRLAAEVLTTAPGIAPAVLPRLALPFAALVGWAVWHYRKARTRIGDAQTEDGGGNPAEMRVALFFACGYALVLVLNAAAKDLLGDRGVLGLAVAGGLTDVDAITLSTTQMVNTGRVSVETAWQSILIASLSNLIFKCGVGFVLGGRRMGLQLASATATALAAAALAWRF
jgi:uncharacterized membrane protein (DUF4010 family)